MNETPRPPEEPIPPQEPRPPRAGGTSSDIDPKLAGLLAYLIPPLTGVVFLLIEKTNPVVRWHAAQSVVFGIACIVVWVALTVIGLIPILGWIVGAILGILAFVAGFVLWVLCLVKGYSGTMWRMPVVAPYADKLLASELGGAA